MRGAGRAGAVRVLARCKGPATCAACLGCGSSTYISPHSACLASLQVVVIREGTVKPAAGSAAASAANPATSPAADAGPDPAAPSTQPTTTSPSSNRPATAPGSPLAATPAGSSPGGGAGGAAGGVPGPVVAFGVVLPHEGCLQLLYAGLSYDHPHVRPSNAYFEVRFCKAVRKATRGAGRGRPERGMQAVWPAAARIKGTAG
jgi:hypothetical protein